MKKNRRSFCINLVESIQNLTLLTTPFNYFHRMSNLTLDIFTEYATSIRFLIDFCNCCFSSQIESIALCGIACIDSN